jgi:hypothetical protein
MTNPADHTKNPPGLIDRDAAYTLSEFQQRFSLGKAAWRTARAEGLPVRGVGRRKFILGADVISWLAAKPLDTSTP